MAAPLQIGINPDLYLLRIRDPPVEMQLHALMLIKPVQNARRQFRYLRPRLEAYGTDISPQAFHLADP